MILDSFRGVLCTASILAAALATSGCATTGATFRSGVGDSFPEHPPYYAGARVAAAAAPIGHLPIAYQRGAAQAPIFDPPGGSESAIGQLLAAMNVYLDSLGATVPLSAERVQGTPPDVRFGCARDASDEDCEARGDSALGRGPQTMRLAVGRPSEAWIASAAQALDARGADRALVLTLEVGQYLMRQTGWRGNKEVELGTGYTVPLPWLTSLETPVTVVQLTGAVVGRDGRAIRIGAEGMLAKRTSLGISALGAQSLVSDEDVAQLMTVRRDDLPGQPLVWQAALRELVAQLTGSRGGE
jgi:hypothetical protein